MLDFLFDPPTRNPGKPLRWILLDSLIIGLIAFTAALPEHPPSLAELYVAFKAFLYAFLAQLMVERGIKPYWYRRRKK